MKAVTQEWSGDKALDCLRMILDRHVTLISLIKIQAETPGLWVETETELERWLQRELKSLYDMVKYLEDEEC